MAHWRVDIIRSRAEHLGVVEAAKRRNRVIVEKMSKNRD